MLPFLLRFLMAVATVLVVAGVLLAPGEAYAKMLILGGVSAVVALFASIPYW